MTTGNKSDKKSFIEQKKYKIHDDFFTESMSNMDLAKEFLEKFLDANILEKIDLSSLVKMPDKYVTKDGKKYFTDALYSVKYDKKREGLLYILMEHKSYPAKEVIFQLLEYMAQIYQQHYDKTSGKVPLVFPVVIYHGKSKWKFDNEFLNYVDVDKEEDKELLKYIPNFIYKLYDVPRMEISREDFSNELKSFVLTLRLKNHTDELRELIKALDKVERQDWGIKIFKYIEEILDQGN